MEKVIIVGCPGSGKSTFSRSLNEITKIPLYHLDMMYWNTNKTTVDKQIFKEHLQQVLLQNSWIIDGNYSSTIEYRLKSCDTLFFLDYSLEVCLEGIKIRRGNLRTDMPWIESPDEEDHEFLEFIKNYNSVNKPKVLELINKYSDKNIFIFKTRNEADEYLLSLKNNKSY